ncbi:MAG: hypothetical protein U1F25_18500 [Rubrivivax sp.]
MTNQAGTFLVSRLPLRNDAGEVIGAVGYVLLDHPETTMQPLLTRLRSRKASSRRRGARSRRARRGPLRLAGFIGTSAAARWK